MALIRISNALRGALVLVFAGVALWMLAPVAFGSFSRHLANQDRIWGLDEGLIAEGRERNFRIVCPEYAEASTWDRWTNPYYWDVAWCEDYIDRLPTAAAN